MQRARRCVCKCEHAAFFRLICAPFVGACRAARPDGDLTMKTTIELMLLAAVGGALLAAPASAQPNHRRAAHTFQYSRLRACSRTTPSTKAANTSAATPIRTFAAKSSRTTANTTATATDARTVNVLQRGLVAGQKPRSSAPGLSAFDAPAGPQTAPWTAQLCGSPPCRLITRRCTFAATRRCRRPAAYAGHATHAGTIAQGLS